MTEYKITIPVKIGFIMWVADYCDVHISVDCIREIAHKIPEDRQEEEVR